MTLPAAENPSKPKALRGNRSRSREFVLRALYTRALNDTGLAQLVAEAHESEGFRQANADFFVSLLTGILQHEATLQAALQPLLDRDIAQLSPIELAVLQIGAFELIHSPELPHRVVLNEAIELTKQYGGTDGHKYVNGVLDRLAQQARPLETRKR